MKSRVSLRVSRVGSGVRSGGRAIACLRAGLMVMALLFVTLMGTACSGDSAKDQVLKTKDFILTDNPSHAPAELPRALLYPGAKLLKSGIYRVGRFVLSPEGVVVFSTPDSSGKVAEHYAGVLKKNDWNTIQSLRESTRNLLMAETPGPRSRRLVTIIMRSGTEGGPTTIKIYFRRNDGG